MAIGKNKKKWNKKGNKKKAVDPFLRKEWYQIKAPSSFKKRMAGFSVVNRTAGTKIAGDFLKGRVFETCLADLQGDEDQAHRKIKLRCEDVQGRDLITSFYGMELTTDKLRSLVRKWQSLIETEVNVKTRDGFSLRIFAIGFTKKRQNQVKTNSYAQTSQIGKLRRRMRAIMQREVGNVDLKDLVAKLIPGSLGKLIEKETESIFPLKDCYVRKVKMVKFPKFDAFRLADMHKETAQQSAEDIGAALVEGAAADEDDVVVDSAPLVGDE